MEFLPLDLLLLDEFSVSDLSEIFMRGVNCELLVLEDSLESLVLGVGLELADEIAIVLLTDEQLELGRLLVELLRVDVALVLCFLLALLDLELLLLLLFLALPLVGIPSGLGFLLLFVFFVLDDFLTYVLAETHVELNVQLIGV